TNVGTPWLHLTLLCSACGKGPGRPELACGGAGARVGEGGPSARIRPCKLGSNGPVQRRLPRCGMDVLSEQQFEGWGMREVEKVGLEQAILHQVEAGSSGLRMSGRELPLSAAPKLTEFLAGHIRNGLRDSQTRAAMWPPQDASADV